MNKRTALRIASLVLFLGSVAVRVLASGGTSVPASAYEPATDAEIAAAIDGAPTVVCVGADTPSGCR